MSNRKLILFVSLILVIAVAAGAAVWLLRPAGAQVVVTVNGREYGTYDLRKDQTVKITGDDNSWYNLLEIKNGRAAIIEADCSNQVCVYTPPLSEDTIGIIVCLPHGVAVELR